MHSKSGQLGIIIINILKYIHLQVPPRPNGRAKKKKESTVPPTSMLSKFP